MALREDIRLRFSGVKDCQKGGGPGKTAARALGGCGSSILEVDLEIEGGLEISVQRRG